MEGSLAGEKFGELTHFEHLVKESLWRINRSANKLLIVSTNLDGFSLANHGRFAKFTNVPPHQSFSPYSIAGKLAICNDIYLYAVLWMKTIPSLMGQLFLQ